MTTTTEHAAATARTPSHIRPLTELDAAWRAPSAGERLAAVREAGRRLRERILASGRVTCVRTFDLTQLPYPTRFGLDGAARSPVPYLVMTNRMNLVQFETEDGEHKTLLFNPTDVERAMETPFFASMRARLGKPLAGWLVRALRKPTPAEHLASVGLRPEDVDYVAFDHMHTQDVRRLLGSTFPRAKLLIWRPELDIFRELHPLQAPWYVRDGVRDVPADRFVVCDGDVMLGCGVALVRTPGHTVGNWSLVMHADSGVWAVSENGIGCDSYAPEASEIPGLRQSARAWGLEVVLNANTLEGRNEQYTSMVLEKTLVDRAADAPAFHQHFASSELTATPVTPGLAPTYSHRAITSGRVRIPPRA